MSPAAYSASRSTIERSRKARSSSTGELVSASEGIVDEPAVFGSGHGRLLAAPAPEGDDEPGDGHDAGGDRQDPDQRAHARRGRLEEDRLGVAADEEGADLLLAVAGTQ